MEWPAHLPLEGGGGVSLELLPNMKIMVNMEGRSFANSSTHKSPIWMHLNNLSSEYDISSDESIISKTLSSSHRFQT